MSHEAPGRLQSIAGRSPHEFGSERKAAATPSASANTKVAFVALLTGFAYYIGSKAGFALTFEPDPISVLWPPNSLLMAALLLSHPRSWWLILLAIFPAHLAAQLQGNVPIPMILGWFISNCAEALLGAICIRRFIGGSLRFDSLREVTVFIVCAGCVAPLLSSFLDAAFVTLNNFGGGAYWDLVATRFFSNSVAALTIVPAIVILATSTMPSLFKADLSRYLECGVLFTGLVIVNFLVFYNQEFALNAGPVFFYLQLPFLFWAVFRMGPAGVSGAVLVLVTMAIWGASSGGGPFVHGSPEQNVRSIQEFLIVVITLLMVLTAIVAERERSGENLRRSKQLNKIVFESLLENVAIVDSSGVVVAQNEAWRRIGVVSAPINMRIGKSFPEVVRAILASSNACDEAVEGIQSVCRGGKKHYEVEFAWHTVSERHWYLMSVTSLDTLDRGAVVILREISDRKRMEQSLRESEAQYRNVVDSQSELVCRYRPDMALTFVNEAYCRFFGRRREDLLGHKLEMIPLPLHEQTPGHAQGYTHNQQQREYEQEVVLKDGEKKWLAWISCSTFNPDGSIGGFQSIGRDITDRKRAEDANERLARAVRLSLVGELTACIMHEINQPLGAILANTDAAEMLLESNPGQLDEVRRILVDIRRDDMRVGQVIRHMKALVGKREMEMQPVNLNDTVAEVLRLVQADMTRRYVTVTTVFGAIPIVWCDSINLQQVVLNLALNSLDAMAQTPKAKRRLIIETREIENAAVEITVSDTGCGIPPQRLSQLFDSFVTTKKDGMGLGLSIARSIVEAHGGKIRGENNADGGATFQFTIGSGNQNDSAMRQIGSTDL